MLPVVSSRVVISGGFAQWPCFGCGGGFLTAAEAAALVGRLNNDVCWRLD